MRVPPFEISCAIQDCTALERDFAVLEEQPELEAESNLNHYFFSCLFFHTNLSKTVLRYHLTFFADFVLFDKIIVEVKANTDGMAEEAIAQTLNYLKASGNRIGLVINFGKHRLEYKRVIF